MFWVRRKQKTNDHYYNIKVFVWRTFVAFVYEEKENKRSSNKLPRKKIPNKRNSWDFTYSEIALIPLAIGLLVWTTNIIKWTTWDFLSRFLVLRDHRWAAFFFLVMLCWKSLCFFIPFISVDEEVRCCALKNFDLERKKKHVPGPIFLTDRHVRS